MLSVPDLVVSIPLLCPLASCVSYSNPFAPLQSCAIVHIGIWNIERIISCLYGAIPWFLIHFQDSDIFTVVIGFSGAIKKED